MLILELVDDIVIVLAYIGHMLQLLDVLGLSPVFFFLLLAECFLLLLASLLSFLFSHLFDLLLTYIGFACLLFGLATHIAGVVTG